MLKLDESLDNFFQMSQMILLKALNLNTVLNMSAKQEQILFSRYLPENRSYIENNKIRYG
jgi:hypothetical protein